MTSRATREEAFLHSLMGRPSAVHTRFVDLDAVADDDAKEHDNNNNNNTPVVSSTGTSPNDTSSSSSTTTSSSGNNTITNVQRQQQQQESIRDASTYFRLPQLNETQEQAANQYLNSKPNTLTLVQGPPGTGKVDAPVWFVNAYSSFQRPQPLTPLTFLPALFSSFSGKSTLLVSIICRYLTESMRDGENGKRLLVSAPTNKGKCVDANFRVEDQAREKKNLVQSCVAALACGKFHFTMKASTNNLLLFLSCLSRAFLQPCPCSPRDSSRRCGRIHTHVPATPLLSATWTSC